MRDWMYVLTIPGGESYVPDGVLLDAYIRDAISMGWRLADIKIRLEPRHG